MTTRKARKNGRAEAFAFSLLLGIAGASAANAQDCRLHEAASLKIEQGPDGLLLVPAVVSGKQILMLLDTGATRGILDSALAAQLGLPQTKIASAQPMFDLPRQPLRGFVNFPTERYYLANGATLDSFTIVPDFALGAVHLDHVQFMLAGINDNNGSPLKGIVGSDMLRAYDVEIDPAGGFVNLFAQDHCPGKVVYWSDAYTDLPMRVTADGQIALEMVLDGHTLDTVLDTGAANTTLSLQIARQIFGVDTDSAAVARVSGDGADTVYRARFTSLGAGGIAIPAPSILLKRDALADRLRDEAVQSRHLMPELTRTPQLILGMDVLRKLHLYIAYGERKLYITGAQARSAGTPANMPQAPQPAAH